LIDVHEYAKRIGIKDKTGGKTVAQKNPADGEKRGGCFWSLHGKDDLSCHGGVFMTSPSSPTETTSNEYSNLLLEGREALKNAFNIGRITIETHRPQIERNFPLRFSVLLLHEALQAASSFLLFTAEDAFNHPSGAVILLRNGFESIVWGTSCLSERDGQNLVGYLWNHQDWVFEQNMQIYKKWQIPISPEEHSEYEKAKRRLDETTVSADDKFLIKGKPRREAYRPRHVKKLFKDLVHGNGLFRYFFETSYKLTTPVWHSSAFGMNLTQEQDVRSYILGNLARGYSECLKVFIFEVERRITGKLDVGSAIYGGLSRSMKAQMSDIDAGKQTEILPSVTFALKLKDDPPQGR